MDQDWLIVDQNDWGETTTENQPVANDFNSTETVEISAATFLEESFILSSDVDKRLRSLVLNLQAHHGSPYDTDYCLRTTMQEIHAIVSQSSTLLALFQSSELTDLWLPMFHKLHRLLSKRQVHYEQAVTALYTLTTMLELDTKVRSDFFACKDAGSVLLETLRHFGKKLSVSEELVVGKVFSLLANNVNLTKSMVQASRHGSKKSINMVHIIETMMKRCSNEEVLQPGRDLLEQSGGYVKVDMPRRAPLMNIVNDFS